MKKFLKLAIPAIAMVAIATGAWTKAHYNSEPTSELDIKNIEAITQSESSGLPYIPCMECSFASCTFSAYDAKGVLGTLTLSGFIKHF